MQKKTRSLLEELDAMYIERDQRHVIETMRITDPGEEAGPVNSFAKGNLLDSIKAKSTMISKENVDVDFGETSKITADVQSAKLKQLLGQIKSN